MRIMRIGEFGRLRQKGVESRVSGFEQSGMGKLVGRPKMAQGRTNDMSSEDRDIYYIHCNIVKILPVF